MDAHRINSSSQRATRPGGAGIVVEKARTGQPHKGRVFVAVHAHLQDLPYYAGGLCAKLILEGYTGYLVRTTNDEKSGGPSSAMSSDWLFLNGLLASIARLRFTSKPRIKHWPRQPKCFTIER